MADVEEMLSGRRSRASLAYWMVSGIVVFVLLGSLSLVLAFERHVDREERRSFEALARANAGFIERVHLPQSGKMAAQLGEIIGARVWFYHPQTTISEADPEEVRVASSLPFNGRVQVMADGGWMVGLPGRDGVMVAFLRTGSERVRAIDHSDTWLALAAFWLLSLAFGWGLARRVTQPLRRLADSLPWVGTDRELPELPVSRRDEIGLLAQTLTRTHESLRAERERRRAAERHALLGKMAASLAHEVRNPVSAIRLHAQLLEFAGSEEAAVSRNLIESEAERIEGLVAQWLSHARPEPPVLAAVDLVELVRESILLIDPQARHAGVEIEGSRAGGGEVARVMADHFRVRQVLGNVLRNAVQAMSVGGRLVVRVEDVGDGVAVVVEDEGMGFSEVALARLGEPFYSEKEGGMGLGLAVAKEVCEAHGGRLMAVNRARGGACVTVVFAKNPRLGGRVEAISPR